MRAIILAAGYGSRMYPLAQDMPKCLLTIGGETLLSRQLRILGSCGISDITVVTGFRSEKIVELYGEEVSVRYNPHYEITGNVFSLWVVRSLLTDDVIIVNADIVCTEESIRVLLLDDNLYCLVVDRGPTREGERRVKVVGDVIIDTSFVMPTEDAFGEAVGIAKVKREGLVAFRESLFDCVKEDSHAGWPDTFAYLARRGCRVNFTLISSPWIEIDTKEDYEEAQNKF